MVLVRRATPSDVEAVAAVFLECWRLSYAAVMPARLVESMSQERARELWASALSQPELTVLIAADEARAATDAVSVLGVTGFRVERDGDGYLSSLYVSPAAQGLGLGGRLLGAAEAALHEAGAAQARLWVFAANRPSLRFYERHGWRLDGRETTLAEWGEPQLGMSKTLDR